MTLKLYNCEIKDIKMQKDDLLGREFFEITADVFSRLTEGEKIAIRNIRYASVLTLINNFGFTRQITIIDRKMTDEVVRFYFR